MAVNHPIARILRFKLDVTRLGYAHEHGVLRTPRTFRLAPSFGSSHDELMAMEVDGVMVHAEIQKSNLHPVPEPDNEGSCRRTCLAVERQPVELHVHRVGSRV